jgi:hypothetical protein
VLDIRTLLNEVATTGRNVGGITLTSSFLNGGIFSYDGVHPNDIGYAVVANEFINVINAHGGSLPPVDLGPVIGVTSAEAGVRASALRPSTSRWVPFEFGREAYANLLAAFPRLDERR